MAEAAKPELKESVHDGNKSAGTPTSSSGRTIDSAERRTRRAEPMPPWVRKGLAALASGVGAKAALKDVIPEYIVLAAGTVLRAVQRLLLLRRHLARILARAAAAAARHQEAAALVLIGVNSFLILVTLAALLASGSAAPAAAEVDFAALGP